MSNERPTSVSVVGWFFMIIGGLSLLSAIGYIVASTINGNAILSAWPGFVQILIAGFIAYGGFGLLRGSAFMRQALEVSSYLIVVLLVVYSVSVARDFSSWGPFLGLALYIIPLAFVIRALRSRRVKAYASKT